MLCVCLITTIGFFPAEMKEKKKRSVELICTAYVTQLYRNDKIDSLKVKKECMTTTS
jgi:hypothetical protein